MTMGFAPLFNEESGREIGLLYSSPQLRTGSGVARSRKLSSSSSSDLAPLVEVLVYSRECGALILSPCRISSVIRERKHLYDWEHLKRRPKQGLFLRRFLSYDEKASLDSNAEAGSGNSQGLEVTSEKDLNENISSPLIGSGGFGRVFISKYNNQKAAIKQLHHRRHSSSFDFWSLCAELNAFRLPRSPYVASIFSFISCGSIVQIVNEFVCGCDLKKLIDDDQWVIANTDRQRIAFQIANGLAHCHSHRLLHLDVKPSNVLVSEDLSVCKLTDFGCSRVADLLPNGILVAPDSVSTSSFGTIAYKAPELLKGGLPTDRADIYSYSLLLYELLSRHIPYPGLHPHAIIFLVAGKDMRPEINELEEKFSENGLNTIDCGLIQLMENCWACESDNRPSATSVCSRVQGLI